MTELRLLVALSELDRERERIQAGLSQSPGAVRGLSALSGLAVGWLARGLMLRSDR